MSIIKTENICKSFGSVEVLKNVSLTDLDTVAQVAAEEGYIRTEDQARLLAFRDNPSDTRWIQK